MLSGPPSPIEPTIDFDAEGVQHGYLRLPWSRDDSAWGNLMIPITVARRGLGPTLLVTGGNHGDEYEGPLAILDLARRLDGMTLDGRVILLPFMNYPAAKAAPAAQARTAATGGRVNPMMALAGPAVTAAAAAGAVRVAGVVAAVAARPSLFWWAPASAR